MRLRLVLLGEAPHLAAVDGEEALVEVLEARAGELLFDPGHEVEDRGIARAGDVDRAPGQASAEPLVERPLGAGGDQRVVEQVVGQRVEQAVGEEPGTQLHRAVEQHLQAVADENVAQGLPQAVRGQLRVARARLASEGERGGVEVVGEEEPPVAGGPSEPGGAEVLESLANGRLPGFLLASVLRNPIDLGGEHVDQACRRPGVDQVRPETRLGPEARELGRGRRPQPGVAVAEGGDAVPQAGSGGQGPERLRDERCTHTPRYAGTRATVPGEKSPG